MSGIIQRDKGILFPKDCMDIINRKIQEILVAPHFYQLAWPNLPVVKDTCCVFGHTYRFNDVFYKIHADFTDDFLHDITTYSDNTGVHMVIADKAVNVFKAQLYLFSASQVRKVLYALDVTFDSLGYPLPPHAGLTFITAKDSFVAKSTARQLETITWLMMSLPNPDVIADYKYLCKGCPDQLLCMMKQRTESGKCAIADKFFQKVDKS